MKIFIDSADIDEIEFIAHAGILDGVTTNPTLIKEKIKARKLRLKGWVKNLSTRVEAVFEGPRDKVEKMVVSCQEGPPSGLVKSVNVQWQEYRGEFRDFVISK